MPPEKLLPTHSFVKTYMHTLHTTNAFILSSSPHGESSRVYRLLTETHGLLYAHAQSVRELRNRNRYALSTATFVSVTLVRGREVWRLTSARAEHEFALSRYPTYRKMLDLIGRLTPIEDPFAQTFRIFLANVRALEAHGSDVAHSIELLGIIRILIERGYLAGKGEQVALLARIGLHSEEYTPELIAEVTAHRTPLVRAVNNALHASSW